MTRFVLDCSITMAWCFEDEADPYADRVLEALGRTETLAPAVWPFEVANVLAVAERRQRIEEAQSTRFLTLLAGLPILVEGPLETAALPSLLATARAFGLSAYDASYLDLAMREGIAVATLDEPLRDAARQAGVPLWS